MADNLRQVTVRLTSVQVLALLGTPRTIVPAPAAGLANIFQEAMISKPAGTAYTIGTMAGLSFKYTDAAGLEVSQGAGTGFLDQATAQTRIFRRHGAASGSNYYTPVAAAPIVLNSLTADVTAGNTSLIVRVWYRVVPVNLTDA